MTYTPELTHPAIRFTPREYSIRGGKSLPSIAGWSIRRAFAPHAIAERFAAVAETDGSPVLIYRLLGGSISSEMLDRLTTARHPHLQHIEQIERDREGIHCLIARYPGSHSGLLTLAQLLSHKPSGTLAPGEARLAAIHLLQAIAAAHRAEVALGSLRPDEVLVDPRGRSIIELPGLESMLRGRSVAFAEAARADVRALAALMHELLTGIPFDPARFSTRSLTGGARSWSKWLTEGLGGGFSSADEAIARLP